MKYLKITVLVSFLLVVILLIAPFLIPKKMYLSWFIKTVESRYPVALTLKDARLAFLPNPGIGLEGLEVKIKKGSETTPFLKAGSFKVSLSWQDVLIKKIAPNIFLKDADLEIVETAIDQFNYSPLLADNSPPHPSLMPMQPISSPTGGEGLLFSSAWAGETSPVPQASAKPTITLKRLEIHNLNVTRKPFQEEAQKYSIETLIIRGVDMQPNAYNTDMTIKGTLAGMILETDLAVSLKLVDASAKQGTLQIHSKDFSLSLPGKLALKKDLLSLQADFSRDSSKTEISKGLFSLGPQRLGLGGVIQSTGAITLSISTDRLELDYFKRVMPALASLPEIQGAMFKANYVTDGSRKAIPTISGSLSAERVKIPDYDFSEVRGGFFYHAPQAKISDFQAKTLDGSVSGNVEVNLQGEKPDYKFDLVMKDISIEKVPSASGLVAGKANLSVKGGGKGFAPEDLSKSLSGDGTMSMNEVQIPAVKFFEGIFSSPAWDVAGNIPGAIDKNALAGLRGVDSKASSLATSFQLVEGRVQIPKVDVQFPKAVTNLSGSIGIDKTLAFSGTMNLDRELASSFIKNPQLLDALAGGKGPLAIPLQVTGTATKPIVSPDGQFIKTGVQNFAKAEAQKKAGELMQGLLKPALPGEATAPQTPPPAKVPSKEDVGNFFKKL